MNRPDAYATARAAIIAAKAAARGDIAESLHDALIVGATSTEILFDLRQVASKHLAQPTGSPELDEALRQLDREVRILLADS